LIFNYLSILVQVPLAVRTDERAFEEIKADGPPPQPRLHPSYSKLRASSARRLTSAKIIKQTKVLAIREYKAAQAKVAAAHSALLRYNNGLSMHALQTIDIVTSCQYFLLPVDLFYRKDNLRVPVNWPAHWPNLLEKLLVTGLYYPCLTESKV
jgi:hypothetical protein